MYRHQNGVFLRSALALGIDPVEILIVVFAVKRVGNAVAYGFKRGSQVVVIEFPRCDSG